MRKIIQSFFPGALVAGALLACSPQTRADQSGLFTYRITEGGVVEIEKYPEDAMGTVDIPSSIAGRKVAIIGGDAFLNCTGMTAVTLPDTMEILEAGAFRNCTGLTSIQIPIAVSSISYGNSSSFYGCTALQNINVAPANITYDSIDGALIGGGNLQICPEGKTGSYAVPSGLRGIAYAFNNCRLLTSISIPASVSETSPFAGCAGLQNIDVAPSNPVLSSIGGVLFDRQAATVIAYPPGRTGSYMIPSGVKQLGDYAFSGSAGLSGVTIPSGLTTIGERALDGCTGLEELDLPESTTTLSWEALRGCTALTRVHAPGLTTVRDGAFRGCSALTAITIPGSVTTINGGTFDGCIGLSSVTLDPGVADIRTGAFPGCTGLTFITIPASVTNLDSGAFSGCSSLRAVEVAPGNPQYASEGGMLFNGTKTQLLLCPEGRPGACVIPPGVTALNGAPFSGCSSMTSVVVPEGVTVIPEAAFSNCTSLKEVSLPATLTEIGSYAFTRCTSLGRITIPAGVVSFDRFAFSGCTSMEAIDVEPANLQYTSIDGVLFDHSRTSLLKCPEGRRGSLAIPPGTTSVAEIAFQDCILLTTVTIPAGCDSMGDMAFSGCTSLTRAAFLGDAPSLPGWMTFLHAAPDFTVYYLNTRSGFTSPVWIGYAAKGIDENAWPAASWLLTYGLWYDTDLHSNPAGGGVSLLMAYALNIDPVHSTRARLPAPTLDGTTLSLSFYAVRPGITYRAETSTDLQNWTTAGVTQAAPGADGQSIATVSRDGPARYLRLAVAD
jgi:hypothetical protein